MHIRSFCLQTFALPSLALRIALADAHITVARAVPSNDSLRALGQKPYCHVDATLDAETPIVALLPDDWNGRFLTGGAGGYVGSVQTSSSRPCMKGMPPWARTRGHTAFALLAEWALRNDRRIADYRHRAVHRTAEVTKALIVAYYGRSAEHSYLLGCSNGGREALVEAQRYPADFDGIVAIAPSFVFLENPEACAFRLASLPACANDVTTDGCVTRDGAKVAAVPSRQRSCASWFARAI
jgi:Tannase and feruloyl esterase